MWGREGDLTLTLWFRLPCPKAMYLYIIFENQLIHFFCLNKRRPLEKMYCPTLNIFIGRSPYMILFQIPLLATGLHLNYKCLLTHSPIKWMSTVF